MTLSSGGSDLPAINIYIYMWHMFVLSVVVTVWGSVGMFVV